MTITTKAIRIYETGGPQVMRWETVDLPPLGSGDVLVKHAAIGFNFIDVVQRSGVSPIPLPSGLGFEAVGVIEAMGASVTDFAVGDTVAYINAGPGAYALKRVVPQEKLAKIPNEMDPHALAAVLFKGLTAQYLLRKTVKVGAGDVILVHAAAGGVGSLLCHWGRKLGAMVLGTASTDEKCRLAEQNGCHHAVNYTVDGWPHHLLDLTGGKRPNVVYDSIGQATFMHSLDIADVFGTVIVFGMASGPAPAIEPELLNKKGCLFLTRPSVFAHNATPELFRKNVSDLLEAMNEGRIPAQIGKRYDLSRAHEAHEDAQARRLKPGAVLVP
ncbi:quinone oxidoreductase family protein [Aminobacter ciceronei]|uniref:NADPH2:quinone reductase n=1 Tax=Aminobacter ciceronei TaxID=150723 RepID=A0ABR6CHC9_9HYPH|nr:quinone oxidoreductase [Aminobacter ciceronei]MBA9024326.1 NADPH2:quinone reductase [Aminobacter ciceronei]